MAEPSPGRRSDARVEGPLMRRGEDGQWVDSYAVLAKDTLSIYDSKDAAKHERSASAKIALRHAMVMRSGASFEICGQGRLKASVFKCKNDKETDKWLLAFPVSVREAGSLIQRGRQDDDGSPKPASQLRSRSAIEDEPATANMDMGHISFFGSKSDEDKERRDSDKKVTEEKKEEKVITPPPLSGGGLSWMDALSAVAFTPAPAAKKDKSPTRGEKDKKKKKEHGREKEEKLETEDKLTPSQSRNKSVASPPTSKGAEFDSNITFKEVLDVKREDEVPRALKAWLEKNDLMRKGSDGWTPLHEACNSHNILLVIELLRLKASPTARSNDGNIPLHYLMKAPLPKGSVEPMIMTYSNAMSYYLKHAPKSIVDAENDRGETPLYRAAQVGNYALVSLLLQSGADPFLAFMPEDRVPAQREYWLRTQELISSMKTAVVKRREEEANLKLQKSSRVGSLFGRGGKDISGTSSVRKITNGPELLRQSFLEAAKNVSGSKRSLSSPLDQMLMAVVSDAFAQRTLEVVHRTFYSAWKASDTWSPMQAMQLSIDRITSLKEERGRYYLGFAHNNEVLQALRDSFTLVNCSDTPLRWEIHRYYPDLASYNADTLRFEIVGKRRGLLAPGAQEKIHVSLLATSACEFAQLLAIQYSEDVPSAEPRATYFFMASSMKPPKDLKELEVDSTLLPNLSDCLGIGGSASVYKVANFLPEKTTASHLAVKKFQYNLDGGLEEHSEDYRRFKLELYISSKMNHPNIVRTYGFTGHPPCLIMEYIEMNLRDLIDDRKTPLSLPTQMKVALHIAKGMAYLHSFNVIHRDLKPANILINSAYDAKVADFGISLADRILDEKLRSNKKEEIQGTQFYMAPELIVGDKNYSIESDVYSYGVILYEVLKRTNLVEEQNLSAMSRIDFMNLRSTGAAPVKSIEGLDSTMKDLIENCWSSKPHERYPFTTIVNILTDHRKRCLHLDLDQEFEEARAERQLHTVLESWNKRILAADEKVAQQFREDFGRSKALEHILEALLTTDGCTDEEAMEVATLFENTLGTDAGELVANLRALVPVLRSLGDEATAEAQSFLVRALSKSLTNREGPALDDASVQAWLDTVVKVNSDARLREFVTTNRFVTEKQALERRLAELKAETKKAKRRLQRLHEAPDSLEYVSGLLHPEKISMRAPMATLEKLQIDVEYLQKQLSDTFDPAEIRKLRQRDNREARIAVALYDSHALAVRNASERLTALAMLLRNEPRVTALKSTVNALLATVNASQSPAPVAVPPGSPTSDPPLTPTK